MTIDRSNNASLSCDPAGEYPDALLYLIGADSIRGTTPGSWDLTPLLAFRPSLAGAIVVVNCPEVPYAELGAETFDPQQPLVHLQPEAQLHDSFGSALQAFADARGLTIDVSIASSGNAVARMHRPQLIDEPDVDTTIEFVVAPQTGVPVTGKLYLYFFTRELNDVVPLDQRMRFMLTNVLLLGFGMHFVPRQQSDVDSGIWRYTSEELSRLFVEFDAAPERVLESGKVWARAARCSYPHIIVVRYLDNQPVGRPYRILPPPEGLGVS